MLNEFSVDGYKNFSGLLSLKELGPINIIHGDNNIGKSNLIEAIDLYFVLVRDFFNLGERQRKIDRISKRLDEYEREPAVEVSGERSFLPKKVAAHTLSQIGLSSTDVFNLHTPRPINISASLESKHETKIVTITIGVRLWRDADKTLLSNVTDFRVDQENALEQWQDENQRASLTEDFTESICAFALQSFSFQIQACRCHALDQ